MNAAHPNAGITPVPPMGCVAGWPRSGGQTWLRAFDGHLAPALRRLNDGERLALARLVPALLCGEQSAVAVFHAEARRLETEARSASVALFRAIEHDELNHEQALQATLRELPEPNDRHATKRRAQRFYAHFGRTTGVAEHFAQIAHLDSAVCRIMRELERSAAGREPAVGALFARIKRDEARHVAASRRHAAALGMTRRRQDALGAGLGERLAGFLRPLADAFDTLEVDPDCLFARFGHGLRT